MQRILFQFDTGTTGTKADTGPAMWGAIAQVHWTPTAADTGTDLIMTLFPRAGDTGEGYEFYNGPDELDGKIARVPVQSGHSDGSDTGVVQEFPIVFAGERLQVKVAPGDTGAVAGRLYVWVDGSY